MSCCKTYDPCLDNKINQIGSYAAAARQSATSSATSASNAAASAAEAEDALEEIQEFFFMPAGGGTDKIFYLNNNQITQNYTVATNKNALTAGPISILSPAIVTIDSGANWTVV